MKFEYLQDIKFLDSIDIDNIGSVTLEALNDLGGQWYLSIQTKLGRTKIVTVGPLVADSNDIPFSFNLDYQYIEFDGNKIVKIIQKFLNDQKKNITQVFFSDIDVMCNRLKNLNQIKIDYQKQEI